MLGVLQREQELKSLASDIEQVGQQIAVSEQQLNEGREQLKALDTQRDQLQSSKLNKVTGPEADVLL